jgi:hypothetical protein
VAYAIGAFSKYWMKTLEVGNIASAVVVMAVAVSLFTPIADPARLSVDDQMRRLASGRVSAEDFDMEFLRFNGARYGEAALRRLRDDTSNEASRALGERARTALTMRNRWEGREHVEPPTRPYVITMNPSGAQLPEGFAAARIDGMIQHMCVDQIRPCNGYLIDFDGDDVDELVVGRNENNLFVYRKVEDARWTQAGTLNLPDNGQEALRTGQYRIVPALIGDLMIGEDRVSVRRNYGENWSGVEVLELEAVEDDAPPTDR